jgi:2-haloacid dehalogenase
MNRPKMLFFDVNETLLDLNAMRTVIGDALGSRPDLLPLWFTTMLHNSLVVTLADQYKDFGELGVAALLMVARNHGVTLSPETAKQAVSVIRSLPAHPDVRPALEELKGEGFRMVTLTNSSQAAVDAQMQNAGLTDLFERRLSVEETQLFKPHSHVYRWAARKLGFAPQDCMLVAAHGWDVAGAIWAGCRAAFISRPGAQLFPLAPEPEIVEPDLRAAAKRLVALEK